MSKHNDLIVAAHNACPQPPVTEEMNDCPECWGIGELMAMVPCPTCHGTGVIVIEHWDDIPTLEEMEAAYADSYPYPVVN